MTNKLVTTEVCLLFVHIYIYIKHTGYLICVICGFDIFTFIIVTYIATWRCAVFEIVR